MNLTQPEFMFQMNNLHPLYIEQKENIIECKLRPHLYIYHVYTDEGVNKIEVLINGKRFKLTSKNELMEIIRLHLFNKSSTELDIETYCIKNIKNKEGAN